MLFLSGQIPIDPDTGNLLRDSVKIQARQILTNLQAVLEAGGMDFNNVVKTTIFLTNMDDFQAVNEVYGEYFPEIPPARATVAVKELPLGAQVEMDMIAVK